MNTNITIHAEANGDFCVCCPEGFVLEVFATRPDAEAYGTEWVRATPTTYGERLDMAKRHNAAYRA